MHHLETKIFNESSEQIERQTMQLRRRENDLQRRQQMDLEVQQALQGRQEAEKTIKQLKFDRKQRENQKQQVKEQEKKQETDTSTTSTTGTTKNQTMASTPPVLDWNPREVCATIMILRTLIESNPFELKNLGYVNISTTSHWQDVSTMSSTHAHEWIASSALQLAHKQQEQQHMMRTNATASSTTDPILRTAGMSQWCSTLLYILRETSSMLLPSGMLDETTHTNTMSRREPLHLNTLMTTFRTHNQTGIIDCWSQIIEHLRYLYNKMSMNKLDVASLFTTHFIQNRNDKTPSVAVLLEDFFGELASPTIPTTTTTNNNITTATIDSNEQTLSHSIFGSMYGNNNTNNKETKSSTTIITNNNNSNNSINSTNSTNSNSNDSNDSNSNTSNDDVMNVKKEQKRKKDVQLIQSSHGLGLTWRTTSRVDTEKSSIYVHKVTVRRPAAQSGKIQVGDILLFIDGVSVEGKKNKNNKNNKNNNFFQIFFLPLLFTDIRFFTIYIFLLMQARPCQLYNVPCEMSILVHL